MNEQKIIQLAEDVAKFVLSKVSGTEITPAEISCALGEALATVIAVPFLKEAERRGVSLFQPEDEGEDKDEDEEFEYQSEAEKAYAFQQLSAKYPEEIVCLVGQGKLKVPQWLQREIVERRGLKDNNGIKGKYIKPN